MRSNTHDSLRKIASVYLLGGINKVTTLLRAMLLVFMIGYAAKADSLLMWDFSFVSIGTVNADGSINPVTGYSGSGTFLTEPTPVGDALYGDELVSLDGQMNGQAMTLIPGLSNAIDPATDDFVPGALAFSINGVDYKIFDFDLAAPVAGNFLVGNSLDLLIDFTVADPTPVTTPEPSAFLLMGLGLACLGIYKLRSRLRA